MRNSNNFLRLLVDLQHHKKSRLPLRPYAELPRRSAPQNQRDTESDYGSTGNFYVRTYDGLNQKIISKGARVDFSLSARVRICIFIDLAGDLSSWDSYFQREESAESMALRARMYSRSITLKVKIKKIRKEKDFPAGSERIKETASMISFFSLEDNSLLLNCRDKSAAAFGGSECD